MRSGATARIKDPAAARQPVEHTLGLPDRQIQLRHTALDLAVVENTPLNRAQRPRTDALARRQPLIHRLGPDGRADGAQFRSAG
jgi:hypothetical protein